MYIDKPVSKRNLIQTISRVSCKVGGKRKGLVVDYIGIKTKMNQAMKDFGSSCEDNVEDIKAKLQVKLILLLAEFGYPPIANDEVFKEILEQAENFKKHQMA
ncbi:type I restriction enzyme endonuclease domain-containing protein [Microbulbifer spongiae]|uniref:DUF3387 domain-containing protein n=1 Tax=Microbulbifer spongiae TaxID=2944933 RepID=A0ABY9E7A1_9GAMM|nr:type I restriction enzyme endonuclease domain-containing protein [Microbulbifer sp. MI-G]WKD48909.1 DUF3387 domain-containing protein [Microbulbifer sp. MI-G]